MKHHGSLVVKTILGALAAAVFFAVIYLFVFARTNEVSSYLTERFGLVGVGLFVFFVDMFIVPTAPDVIFPLVMGWNPLPVLLVMSAASSAGGFCGYLLARRIGTMRRMERLFVRARTKGEPIVQHYGAWAVMIAALTPIPFSTVCWTAGLLKVPVKHVAPAVLARLPRMVTYYLLIRGGVLLLS